MRKIIPCLLLVASVYAADAQNVAITVGSLPDGVHPSIKGNVRADLGYLRQALELPESGSFLVREIGENGKKHEIIQQLKSVGPCDVLVLYFSGVGGRIPATGEAYLACSDSTVASGAVDNVLRASEVRELLKTVIAKKKILIIDSAFSSERGKAMGLETGISKAWLDAPGPGFPSMSPLLESDDLGFADQDYAVLLGTRKDFFGWLNRQVVQPVIRGARRVFDRAGSVFTQALPGILSAVLSGGSADLSALIGGIISSTHGTQAPLVMPGPWTPQAELARLGSTLSSVLGVPIGHSDKIRLVMKPQKPILKLQEPVELLAEVTAKGFVFLLNVTTKGEIEVLPTQYSADGQFTPVPDDPIKYAEYAALEKGTHLLGRFSETREGAHLGAALYVSNQTDAIVVAATLLHLRNARTQLGKDADWQDGQGKEAKLSSRIEASAVLGVFVK